MFQTIAERLFPLLWPACLSSVSERLSVCMWSSGSSLFVLTYLISYILRRYLSYLYDISMYDVAYRHPQAAPSKTSIIQAGRSVLNNVDVSGDCTLT